MINGLLQSFALGITKTLNLSGVIKSVSARFSLRMFWCFYIETRPPGHKLNVALLAYFNMARHAVCSTPALERQQCRHAASRRCISVVCCALQAIMDGKQPKGV